MTLEEIKREVTRKVHKEYKEFIEETLKSNKWSVIDNAIKISFYKEIHIYVLNGIVEDSYYKEMAEMKEIIPTLWDRFYRNAIDKDNEHFLNQILEFHKKNKSRMNINAKELKGERYKCLIG